MASKGHFKLNTGASISFWLKLSNSKVTGNIFHTKLDHLLYISPFQCTCQVSEVFFSFFWMHVYSGHFIDHKAQRINQALLQSRVFFGIPTVIWKHLFSPLFPALFQVGRYYNSSVRDTQMDHDYPGKTHEREEIAMSYYSVVNFVTVFVSTERKCHIVLYYKLPSTQSKCISEESIFLLIL